MARCAFLLRFVCPLVAVAIVLYAGIAAAQQPSRPARGQATGKQDKGQQATTPREEQRRKLAAAEAKVAKMSLDEVREAFEANPQQTEEEKVLARVQRERIAKEEADKKNAKSGDGLRERFQKRAIFAKEVEKLSLPDLKAAHATNPRETEDDQFLWEAQRRQIRRLESRASHLVSEAERAERSNKRKAMEDEAARMSIADLRASIEANPHRTEEERVRWLVQQDRLEKAEVDAQKRAKKEVLAKKRAEMNASVAKLGIPELEEAIRKNPRKTTDERMLWTVQKDRLGQARWEALSPEERKRIQNARAFFFMAALEAISQVAGGSSSSDDDPYRESREANARKIQKDAYEDSLKYLPRN